MATVRLGKLWSLARRTGCKSLWGAPYCPIFLDEFLLAGRSGKAFRLTETVHGDLPSLRHSGG